MELIKGKESLFYIVKNGVEIPVGCLTSNPIDESAEMMETTTRDNEGWRTSVPTMQSYSIALDGFMTMDDPNSGKNIISYRELRKIKRNREQIVWKIKTLNGWYVDSGKAYIESISFSDPVDDMIGFSANLVGYGIPNDTNAEYDIYSDEITYNFTYSHEPENDPNSGQWFLANLLFNNYHNSFGIVYDCALKIKLTGIPAKGFIAHNTTAQIFTIGDEISYCDKDNLVYYPNGFNNDLGVTGNFAETFSYKIVDQDGRIGRDTTHTILMTDIAVAEPIDISVSILWNDNTSAPQTGNSANIIVKLGTLVFDPTDPIITQQWEVFDGSNWIFYADKTADSQTIALPYMANQIRLKVVSQYSVTAYSNILTYTKIASANIYITNVIKNEETGDTSYKLHVENVAFVGFANVAGTKNFNARNAFIDADNGERLYIPGNSSSELFYTSKAVNIPVGVYDLNILARGLAKDISQDVIIDGRISYGFTPNYDDSNIIAEAYLFIPANL